MGCEAWGRREETLCMERTRADTSIDVGGVYPFPWLALHVYSFDTKRKEAIRGAPEDEHRREAAAARTIHTHRYKDHIHAYATRERERRTLRRGRIRT